MTLRTEGIRAVFGGVVALDGVSVEVAPGEIVSVIGPNGSGKSTLFNAITGFVPTAAGTVHCDGRDISNLPTDRRIQAGIARTFQTPRIDLEATVLTSVLCGYLMNVHAGVVASVLAAPPVRRDEQRIVGEAHQLLADFGMGDLAEVPIGQLSMGQVRMVDVLRAMAMAPAYLLLDEPAAGLSDVEQARLIEGIRAIAARGVGVLLVEHNFRLVREVADRVVVLQKGTVLMQGTPAEVAEDEAVVNAYLGVGTGAHLANKREHLSVAEQPVRLECSDFSVSYGRARVCRDVDLSVRTGQILALLGPNGAGKSSLLAALAGISLENRRWSGQVRLGGRDLGSVSAEERARVGLALVPEGRRNSFASMTVEENLDLGLRKSEHSRRTGIRGEVLEILPALNDLLHAPVGLLSGGEQQMVAIGMALAGEPQVLLLDEPTQGLAPAILDILVDTFSRLRERELGIILAEQNYAFAASLADEYVVLAHGSIVSRGDSEDLARRDEIAAAYL